MRKCFLLTVAVLVSWVPAAAQLDQVTISLPAAVSFDVNVTGTTIGTPPTTSIEYSGASVSPGRVLRISVVADASAFAGPGAPQVPASAVSWTVANASGGVASSGTLAAGVYTQVFQSSLRPSSGRFDFTWTLAQPPAGVRAGVHTLTLRWKIESVRP